MVHSFLKLFIIGQNLNSYSCDIFFWCTFDLLSISSNNLLNRRQRCLIRSVLLVIVGWFVGNAVFSETALMIFLIFCMMDYKGRKVAEPDFLKKFLIWRYSRKGLQISSKSDRYFSQKRLYRFFLLLAWS